MPRHKSNSDVDFRADRRKEVIVIDDGESLAANRPRRRASIPAAAKLAALARSEKAGDDDDCLIVSESIQTPRRGPQPRKSRGGASVAANMRRLARTTSLEVELHMECVEEALSYYQVQAAKRAEEEYRAALQQIRVAQAEVAAEQQRQLQQQQEQQAKRNKELQQQLIQMRQQKNQITIAPSTGPHADMMLMNKPQVIAPRTMQQKPRKQIINPVRYDNIQTTSRNTVQGSITYASPVIAGALNSGVKRPLGSDFDNPQIVKRRTNSGQIRRNENEAGSWVPLDEYYYGKKEGDPAYREEKGEFRFKCWFCHKMLYNNVRMMLHMQAHIDSEKQQNLDLSDLTQCKHCYKQFDTPFDMQCHIERVHQNTSNVLVCRICEKDHENQIQLRSHMKTHHTACEMPYICQLCNFRSSIYSDVVDHFKKRHDSSQHTMCLYCLRVFRINFSKQNGWGLTQNYWQHLQRHQALNRKKKCPCCKLTFINAPEVKVHKTKDHLPNQKASIRSVGAGLKAALASQNQGMVMIQVPEGGGTKGKASKPKSLNAPSVNKVRDLRGLRFSAGSVFISNRCLECQEPMSGSDHFKRYVECSMCRYATTCNNAYSNHMMAFHTGSATMTLKVVRNERRMDYKMYCLCGFSSNYGNSVANHLVFCSKRTAYSTKPEPKWFEYDDEQEDFNPFESYVDEPDVPEVDAEPKKDLTLLGALGLVKKKSDCSTPDLEEETPDQVVQYAVSSVLDAIFPAEAAAEEVIDGIMSRLEEHIAMKERLRIAEELKKAKASNEQSNSTGQRPPKTKQKFGRPKVSIMGGYKAQKKDDRASSKTEERDLPTPPSASHEDSLQSFDDITSRDDSSTVLSREEDSLSRDAYSESGFRDDRDSLSRDSEDPPKDSAETLFAKAMAEEPKDAQSETEMGDTKIDEIKSEGNEDKEVKSQGTPTDSKDNEEQNVPMETEEDPKPADLDETPMETDQDKTDTVAIIEDKSENEANETALKSDANEASGAPVDQMDTEDTEHPQGATKTMDEQDEEAKSTMDTKSDNAETDSVEATLLAAEPKLQSADLEEPEPDSESAVAASEESEVAEPAKDADEEPETRSAELVKDNEKEQEKTADLEEPEPDSESAMVANEESEVAESAKDAGEEPEKLSAEPVKHVSEEQHSTEPVKDAGEEPETPSTEPAMDAEDKPETPSAKPAKDADEESETPAVEPESAPVEPTTAASEETKDAELKEDDTMNTSEGPEKSEPDQHKSKEVAPEETSEETSMEKSEFKARESHEHGKETKTEGISPTVDERLTLDKEETKREPQKEPKPEEGETKGSDIERDSSGPSVSSTPTGRQTSVIDKSADGTKSGEPGQGDAKVKLSEGGPAQKDTKDPVVDTESKPKVYQDTAHQKAASTSAPRKPEHERTETAQSSKGSDSARRPPSDSFKGQLSHRHGDYRDDRRRDDSHRHDSRKYDNRYGDRDRHGHRDYRDDRGYRDDRHGGRDRYGYQGGSGDYHQGGYRGDRRDQHQDRNRGWGGHHDRHDRRDQHGNRGGGGGGGYRGGQGNRGGYNRGGYHGYY